MVMEMSIRILIGIAGVAFVIYGLLNEQKFIDFENRFCRMVAKKIAAHKRKKAIAKKRAVQAARRRRELERQRILEERARKAGIYRNVA